MSCLRRYGPPAVIPAVEILHRRLHKLGGIEIVKAGKIDRDIGAAHCLDVTVAICRHPAIGAEAMMPGEGSELIVADACFLAQQAEILWLDVRAPVAELPADRAIALSRPGLNVDIGLVADPAAMAASVIGLLHVLLLAHSHVI